MPRSALTKVLNPLFERVARRRAGWGAPQVLVQRGDEKFRYGDQHTPFHAASVGKLFTTAVVLQLVEEGRFTLGDGIDRYLPSTVLAGLFSQDAPAPTILQLLQHVSGASDYYEGSVLSGPSFHRRLLADLDQEWPPMKVLDFARTQQRPIGKPGERFVYSDTGFDVLGMLIEAIDGTSYHAAVTKRIIDPLELHNTFLPRLTAPREGSANLAPCYLGRIEVSTSAVLSCGWAGGGIAATPADLLRFSQALHGGELVNAAHLALMGEVQNRVRAGIHYGAGMMELRLGGFSPFLRGQPAMRGHIGSLSTYVFYEPESSLHVVMNFHSSREMSRGIRSLIGLKLAIDRL